jgi:protein TonB
VSAVLYPHAGVISTRDLVSFGMAALFLLLALGVGKIRTAPDEDVVTSSMSLTTEPVREQKNNSTPEQLKSEPKTAQIKSPSKEVVTEKINKVEDSTSSVASSDASKQTAVKASPATPSADVKKADLDTEFEHKIRQLIEASKRYPTGREASQQKPQGVVVGCVLLQRDGSLQEMKIQKSSTYPLLDNAAKRLLSNLQYPAMPEDIFPGRANHSFCVNLDYKIPA